eukprot:4774012-Prymnesium_polylepis.1
MLTYSEVVSVCKGFLVRLALRRNKYSANMMRLGARLLFSAGRRAPTTSLMPASIAAAELADRQRLRAAALFVRTDARDIAKRHLAERGSRTERCLRRLALGCPVRAMPSWVRLGTSSVWSPPGSHNSSRLAAQPQASKRAYGPKGASWGVGRICEKHVLRDPGRTAQGPGQ